MGLLLRLNSSLIIKCAFGADDYCQCFRSLAIQAIVIRIICDILHQTPAAMRTVLMFGWEFPPHISGGLGTACLGLTEALTREGCKVLFVVPRAFGDEPVPLLSASDVLVGPQWQHHPWNVIKHDHSGKMQVISVRSDVLPYGHQESPGTVRSYTLHAEKILSGTKSTLTGGRRFEFLGGYGGDLFLEVVNYSKVAAQLAQENLFDLVHAHDWFTYPAGIMAKKVSGKPLIVHVHSTEYDRAGAGNLNPFVVDVEREGMAAADRVVAVSEWTKSIIVERYNISASKVTVVHNGILRRRVKAKTLVREMEYVVTFLGRITYQKGPSYFVDAARIVQRYLPGAHFVMAGSGDLFAQVVEEVARSRMGSRFHFTGFLSSDEVDELWARTDVYVMPSVSEPFGITPLEAIQAGVPVIVSNQSGVSEVLPHAIKVDFWDVEKLADSIVNILIHDALSGTLRKSGRRQARSLTWQRAARKLLRLYSKLAQC